jgi:hypothetical protein
MNLNRRFLRSWLLAGALILSTTGATAAEFDLSSNETFLSPDVLASFRKSGRSPQFLRTTFFTAVEDRYLYRSDYSDASGSRSELASDLHAGRWQYGANYVRRFAMHNRDKDATLPVSKGGVHIGYYQLVPSLRTPVSTGSAALPPSYGRLLVGWNRTRLGGSGERFDEFSANVSVKLFAESILQKTGVIRDVTGGYSYAWRPKLRSHFAAYNFRGTVYELTPHTNIIYAMQLGAERKSGDWRFGWWENGLLVSMDSLLPRVHMEAGWSISRDWGADRWRNHFVLVARVELLSKLIRK